MKNRISYTDEPIGKIEIIKDFLPSPEELVHRDTNIKVTINLKKTSVNFFKNVARKHHSQYQRVIRNVLDSYASNFSKTR
jgi:predicted DNA binding CopG/RHH family protein